MKKTIKNIGLDVHKNSISIAIADDGRDGDVRYYGKIDNDMSQLDKVIRKLISKGGNTPICLRSRSLWLWYLSLFNQ